METRETAPSFALRLVLGSLLLLSLCLGPAQPAFAGGPYEPNDSIPVAFGPLLAGQEYSGAIEGSGDRDYFYFYVTSPKPAKVTLAMQNLGGESQVSDIDLTVLDTSSTPMGSIAFVRTGETRQLELRLPPQKYIVEIMSREEFGDSYAVTPAGDHGAFGPYDPIAGRCGASTQRSATFERRLERMTIKLQHSLNRLRRSRYDGQDARLIARRHFHAVKVAVRDAREGRDAAEKARDLWCAVPR